MQYPGRVIKEGENNKEIVKAIKQQLNRAMRGGGAANALDPNDPNFGPKMKQAVKFFQARHVDAEGRPLVPDGVVGSLTWAVLFGSASVAVNVKVADPLLSKVLAIAAGEEGVREIPQDSNRGPQVEAYLVRVDIAAGNPWCCAFVYWCFDEAAQALGRGNPMVRTAGCLDHWNRAPSRGAKRIMASAARNDPALLAPGMVFIMDFGEGKGHTGLIESINGGLLTTIEGNTDASKTREGGGVYRLTRKVGEISKGYIDYRGV